MFRDLSFHDRVSDCRMSLLRHPQHVTLSHRQTSSALSVCKLCPARQVDVVRDMVLEIAAKKDFAGSGKGRVPFINAEVC